MAIDFREIDIAFVLNTLWKRRLAIAASAAAGLVIGAIYLHFATYVYTAQLQVAPTQASNSIASKLGGLGDLASAAGVSLGQDSGPMQYRLYIEGLRSRTVANELARRTDIMRVLFSDEWDDKTHGWVQPERGFIGQIILLVKQVVGVPIYAYEPPDGARLQTYLDTQINVDRNPKNTLATITYNNKDPAFAVAFLAALHKVDDDLLRRKALARSQQYIKYLSEKLPTVTIAEHRQAISDVLSDQEKSMMMASAQLAYAAEPYGPPSASYRPTTPLPIPVLVGSIVAGALLGVAYAALSELGLLAMLFRRRKAQQGLYEHSSPAHSAP